MKKEIYDTLYNQINWLKVINREKKYCNDIDQANNELRLVLFIFVI